MKPYCGHIPWGICGWTGARCSVLDLAFVLSPSSVGLYWEYYSFSCGHPCQLQHSLSRIAHCNVQSLQLSCHLTHQLFAVCANRSFANTIWLVNLSLVQSRWQIRQMIGVSTSMHAAVFATNTSTQSTTKVTPFRMMFNREPRTLSIKSWERRRTCKYGDFHDYHASNSAVLLILRAL